MPEEEKDIIGLRVEQEALENFKEDFISFFKLIYSIGNTNQIDLIDFSNIYTQTINLNNSLISLLKHHPQLLREIEKEIDREILI